MRDESPSEISQLLGELSQGSADAWEALMPLVYKELRALAGSYFRGERQGHTLQPTALVNEAFLRLIGQQGVDWQGKAHFFALSASTMRRILVDHARRRAAGKRGGEAIRIPIEAAAEPGVAPEADLLDLDDCLGRLEQLDAQAARVVELRFFAGATVDETAEALAVSASTVARDWRMARAWLRKELSEGPTGGP